MCILSIKVPIRKKSGNLFNDPRTLKLTKLIYILSEYPIYIVDILDTSNCLDIYTDIN